MKYQDLIESVRTDARLDSNDHARETVSAVLTTVAHGIPPEDRTRLAEALPGSLESAAEVPGPREPRDGAGVVTEIGRRLDVEAERARYLAQAVFGALRANDPELADRLHGDLDADVREVLTPSGEASRRAESERGEVPTELSDAEVDQALRRLTGWTGDHTAISRTVQLPADRLEPLVNQVQRVAGERNDKAAVSRDSTDTVTFTLRTGRPGVVTEPDIELAEQIDRVVFEVGSGGQPG
ncbi:DUF2267 domain-containing protein [Saccharomonospora iraqiensis]|uniref:DUF2267 domain-containing protein n=1 Tax=Saccharomonospora iraqiensis TaxID=52698 RepID=UPI00022DFC91|nr:DUF2267 domain-containing protein [Saccharomonospora iraqiensis]